MENNKKISIIIPCYKEEGSKIIDIINLIDAQIGIDFHQIEVILVSDGEESNDISELSCFDFYDQEITIDKAEVFSSKQWDTSHAFEIFYYRTRVNGGPGVTRQHGINEAKGDFVMFIDADDILHSVAVLNFYLTEIELCNGDFDMLTTNWIEEQKIQGIDRFSYLPHTHDLTWMFGKLINRKFLIENGIKFHDDLRVHEDSHFLSRVNFNSTPHRIRTAPATTYVWRYSENTITRRDNADYTYNSFAEFIRAHSLALEKNVMLNKPDMMTEAVIQLICYSYVTLNAPHWDAHADHKEDAIKMLKSSIYEPFKAYASNVSEELLLRIYQSERMKHGNYIEKQTFYQWLVDNGMMFN